MNVQYEMRNNLISESWFLTVLDSRMSQDIHIYIYMYMYNVYLRGKMRNN